MPEELPNQGKSADVTSEPVNEKAKPLMKCPECGTVDTDACGECQKCHAKTVVVPPAPPMELQSEDDLDPEFRALIGHDIWNKTVFMKEGLEIVKYVRWLDQKTFYCANAVVQTPIGLKVTIPVLIDGVNDINAAFEGLDVASKRAFDRAKDKIQRIMMRRMLAAGANQGMLPGMPPGGPRRGKGGLLLPPG